MRATSPCASANARIGVRVPRYSNSVFVTCEDWRAGPGGELGLELVVDAVGHAHDMSGGSEAKKLEPALHGVGKAGAKSRRFRGVARPGISRLRRPRHPGDRFEDHAGEMRRE